MTVLGAVGEFFVNVFEGVKSIVQNIVAWITGVIDKIGESIGWVIDLFDREARQERRQTRREQRRGGDVGLISPQEAVITSQALSEERSTVDVNFSNLPAGSSVRQTGSAPGVTIRTGFAEAVL